MQGGLVPLCIFFGVMEMFKRIFTLNRVRDSVTFREGNEEINLYVDSDANSLVSRLQKAQEQLLKIDDQSSLEDRKNAAEALADAVFGHEQTKKIFDFYHGDANCVVTICGMYFADKKHGLARKIVQVQKHER